MNDIINIFEINNIKFAKIKINYKQIIDKKYYKNRFFIKMNNNDIFRKLNDKFKLKNKFLLLYKLKKSKIIISLLDNLFNLFFIFFLILFSFNLLSKNFSNNIFKINNFNYDLNNEKDCIEYNKIIKRNFNLCSKMMIIYYNIYIKLKNILFNNNIIIVFIAIFYLIVKNLIFIYLKKNHLFIRKEFRLLIINFLLIIFYIIAIIFLAIGKFLILFFINLFFIIIIFMIIYKNIYKYSIISIFENELNFIKFLLIYSFLNSYLFLYHIYISNVVFIYIFWIWGLYNLSLLINNFILFTKNNIKIVRLQYLNKTLKNLGFLIFFLFLFVFLLWRGNISKLIIFINYLLSILFLSIYIFFIIKLYSNKDDILKNSIKDDKLFEKIIKKKILFEPKFYWIYKKKGEDYFEKYFGEEKIKDSFYIENQFNTTNENFICKTVNQNIYISLIDKKKLKNNNKIHNINSINKNENNLENKKNLISKLNECYICLTNLSNIIINPCNHGNICSDCSTKNWGIKNICSLCNIKVNYYLEMEENNSLYFVKYYYIKIE